MKTLVTSDLHFYHRNILKFCPRVRGQYSDMHDMNERMIEQWNEEVSEDDLVYNLGDVSFAGSEKTAEILGRLNGRQILILGNHDNKLMKSQRCRDQFEEIHDYLEVDISGKKVVMFHYPIWEWKNCHRGSVHLYGHIHDSIAPMPGRHMNVGFDYTGKIVTDLHELVDEMSKIEKYQTHHN